MNDNLSYVLKFFCSLCHVSDNFLFYATFHVNVDWFKTVCVSLTPNVDLTYAKNMKKNH